MSDGWLAPCITRCKSGCQSIDHFLVWESIVELIDPLLLTLKTMHAKQFIPVLRPLPLFRGVPLQHS